MRLRRDVYSGTLRLYGREHKETTIDAFNYANDLLDANRSAEAKALLRQTLPVARRVLGATDELTLKMRWTYACALYDDAGATLDDIREAVTTLEETAKTIRQVYGGTHPLTVKIGNALRESRAALAARETQ